MSALLSLKDIHKSYHIGDQTQHVLKGVNITINQGDMVSIMGESGSGKSTLMNIIGLLDRADSGEYHIKGENVSDLSNTALAGARNQMIGFIFQSFFLLPRLTALQNVMLPLSYRQTPAAEMHERAHAVLEKVGLGDKTHHKPSELSGGQQQRVAIARALVGEPTLLLADEPTGALDHETSSEVLSLFQALNNEGKTILIITHDPSVGESCKTEYLMEDGLLRAK